MHTTSHANRPGEPPARPERYLSVPYTGPHHLRYSGDCPTGASSSITGHATRISATRKEACFFSCPRLVARTTRFSTVGIDCSTKAAFSQRQERTNVFAVYAEASRSFSTDRSSGSFPCFSDQVNGQERIALSIHSDLLFHFTFAPVLLVSLYTDFERSLPFWGTL